jgi:hypothetical protein
MVDLATLVMDGFLASYMMTEEEYELSIRRAKEVIENGR